MDAKLRALSEAVGQALVDRRLLLAAAESCTGGWVAEALTATAGSSQWFERGFVTYSDAAKLEMLGVGQHTLSTYGAVSREVASEMATGALARSHADVALAVTGVAGPGGGSPAKPVGTVCFAWCLVGRTPINEIQYFSGDREAVRRQSVAHTLQHLLALVRGIK